MKKPELLKVADLLGLVYVPAMVETPTAVQVSQACTDLSRLQQALRELADTLPEEE